MNLQGKGNGSHLTLTQRKELMIMEKMTNVKALEVVLAMEGIPAEVREKLEKMKAGFVKKSTAERKPTANQTENAGFKTAILDAMVEGKAYTVSEIQKLVPALAEISGQRVSAIVTQLKNEGAVIRTEEKRKAYFTKVAEPTEVDED